MLSEHRDVGERTLPLDERQVLREALEFPARAGEERVDVHALDHRQVAKQRLAERRRTRRDAEAAVAHHDGGDAERDRGRERRVPGDLRVVVRMQVDDARHERKAAGVERAARRLIRLADRGDGISADADRACETFGTAAVADARAADEEVEHPPMLN